MIDHFRVATLSLVAVLVACSSTPVAPVSSLTVKEDYTAPHVIRAFDRRYRVKEVTLSPPPVMIEGRNAAFSGLGQAVQAATDGDVIVLGSGLYHGSILAQGKQIRIRGQGSGQTIFLAGDTALYVDGGSLSVSGVGFWSLTVGPDVPVVSVKDATVEFDDCRFSGATGPGLMISGENSKVRVVGSMFVGNMGGGALLQGGSFESLRNVYTRNAMAGIVFQPSTPDSIRSVDLWHDTLLDNWQGSRCLSFLLSGMVRLDAVIASVRIAHSILNHGGIADTLSDAFWSSLVEARENFLSTAPLPAEDFFVDAAGDDFRPRAAILEDPTGIELGALPSEPGLQLLRQRAARAAQTDRLRMAYLISLFLPKPEQTALQSTIQERVFVWASDFMNSGRIGERLVGLMNLTRIAPREWHLSVILERVLGGFISRYTYAMRPLNFFDEQPGTGAAVVDALVDSAEAIPRFISPLPDGPRAFVLSGEVTRLPAIERTSQPFSVSMPNPYHQQLVDARALLQRRKTEQDRKAQDLHSRLNNPHLRAPRDSRSRQAQEQRLETMKNESIELGLKLKDIETQLAEAQPMFQLTVSGQVLSTVVSGEFSAQLVLAPEGAILLDEVRTMNHRETRVAVDPIPDYHFAGIRPEDVQPDPVQLTGRAVARQLLTALVSKEAGTIRLLLDTYSQGLLQSDEEDRLVEMLILNAVLYRRAMEARDEYLRLRRSVADSVPRVTLTYDPARGSGKAGVGIEVEFAGQEDVRLQANSLQDLYEPYWQLQPAIDEYLRSRYSMSRDGLFELRRTLESMAGMN